jgi:ferredoxin
MGVEKVVASNSELFIGNFRDLEAIARLLQKSFDGAKLYGYKLQNDRAVFGELSSVSELPLKVADVQKPGSYRLVSGIRFRHGSDSPKVYLLPPEHAFIVVSQNYDIAELYNGVKEGAILFGIKPCDRKAIEILDRIIYGKNPVYTKRRDAVKAIVVEECLEPAETCFCSAVNAGPTISTGFDIAYARLHEDLYLFKFGSSLGEKILSRVGVKKAEESHVKEYLELVNKATSTMNTRVPSTKNVQDNLKARVNDKKFWEEVSSKCVGCGNCNYVCPTCFCIEIEDRIEDGYSKRVGMWTGCRTYTYGLVAGAHFRRDLYTRFRHFVLHKFTFYPIQVGDVGCVGCGRCSVWCPLGIDLKETLNRLTEVKVQ